MSQQGTDGTPVIVGLGNPGPRYVGTRHNVGAMVVRELAERSHAPLKAHKTRAAVSQAHLAGPGSGSVVLATPTSFMNESGGPVAALLKFYSQGPQSLIVIHDDLDIDAGQVRLKVGGGEGGHNGLRSISASIGTRDYTRVRVGIGRPPGRMDPADYVLRDFSAAERAELPFTLDLAADAATAVVSDGLASAQQQFHSR